MYARCVRDNALYSERLGFEDLESLKLECEQRIEFLPMLTMRAVENGRDGVLEVGESLVVLGVERFLLRKLPQPLDEVQVRGIGRKKEQINSQRLGGRLCEGAALVGGVVEHNGDGKNGRKSSDLAEQFADTFGVNVLRIAHGNQTVSCCTNGAENVKSLPTWRRSYEHPYE